MPNRIQLRRTKGWRKPAGAIVCARPGKWGNPFRASQYGKTFVDCNGETCRSSEAALRKFAVADFEAVVVFGACDRSMYPSIEEIRAELTDHDLCCWCRLCDRHRDGKPLGEHCPDCAPCHVDVLGELLYGRAER